MVLLKPLLAWTAVLLSSDHILSKNINTFAGPFIAYAHRFDVCPSDGTIVLVIKNTHFSPAKPFEKQMIVVNSTVRAPVDDSYWGHVNMAVRANNQWKENAFIFNFPGGGCSALREHLPSFFYIVTKYDPEVRDKRVPCRFKPGVFAYENQSIGWEFPNFKVMPYGHYRFTITAGKGSQVKKLCVAVDCEIIPKPL